MIVENSGLTAAQTPEWKRKVIHLSGGNMDVIWWHHRTTWLIQRPRITVWYCCRISQANQVATLMAEEQGNVIKLSITVCQH
ncbi:MAG: hypothetical protein ACLRRF_09625 [Clostridium fessum]